jgi:hypothetical protein
MGKFYPEEVKNKALELNRLDEKTTYADVGRDPEISPERIRHWVWTCWPQSRVAGRVSTDRRESR